jgi:arsenate reductase (thioredoxin)
MGCGDACPWIPAKVRADWAIPDPKHMEPEQFRIVRNLIRDNVANALRTIGALPT